MSEPKLPIIAAADNQFVANGRKYYIQKHLSVRRWVVYLQLSTELTYGVTFAEMNTALKKIYAAASSGNDVIGALRICSEVSLNSINAVVNFSNNPTPKIMTFCALFINRDNENIKEWDERVVESKVEDWTKAGMRIDDFFVLAASFMPEFKQAFRNQRLEKSLSANDVASSNSNTTDTNTTKTSPNPLSDS